MLSVKFVPAYHTQKGLFLRTKNAVCNFLNTWKAISRRCCIFQMVPLSVRKSGFLRPPHKAPHPTQPRSVVYRSSGVTWDAFTIRESRWEIWGPSRNNLLKSQVAKLEYWHGFSGERWKWRHSWAGFNFLLLELLSINTCVNTYASARRTHGSKCTKTNLSKAFCASYGTPANISEPSFQHA